MRSLFLDSVPLSLSPFSRLLPGTNTSCSCSCLSTVFVWLISLYVCQQGRNPRGNMGFGGRGGGKGKGKGDGKGKGNRYEDPIPDYVTGVCFLSVCCTRECSDLLCCLLVCVCVSMRWLSPRCGGSRSEVLFCCCTEVGYFTHTCEGELICRLTNENVPYFNAMIFLENKTKVGKLDEIFGAITDVVRPSSSKETFATRNKHVDSHTPVFLFV